MDEHTGALLATMAATCMSSGLVAIAKLFEEG
jgi:hypothetical protein